MRRLKAREQLEWFDLIRTAVNSDKDHAREWYDRTLAIAEGRDLEAEPEIVIASEEDAAKFLRSIGR